MKTWILCLLGLAVPLVAQTERDPSKMTDEEKRAVAEQVMALQGPGPEHEILAARAGEFDTQVKFWMQPGGSPIILKGSLTNKMVLGGRFLQAEAQSGQGSYQFEKMTILGFDRRFGKYTLSGYDTMGTYAIHAEGDYDAETRTLTLSGTEYDPTMEITMDFDIVYHFDDADHSRMEVWFKDHSHGNTEPFKMVEVQSTRRKD